MRHRDRSANTIEARSGCYFRSAHQSTNAVLKLFIRLSAIQFIECSAGCVSFMFFYDRL
jgi:hypothetical protein